MLLDGTDRHEREGTVREVGGERLDVVAGDASDATQGLVVVGSLAERQLGATQP